MGAVPTRVISSEEADLVVVGAGAGGMAAALTAALNGLKVILCEATDRVGGTTATSAGTIWIPGNRHGVEAGYGDSPAKAREYLAAMLGKDDSGSRDAYLDGANEAIDYLERNSEVKFSTAGKHPDYLELPGAALAGRALAPLEFDGRKLGRDFIRIRAPIPDFMILGGMMVNKADVKALINRYRSMRSFAHSVKLVMRYGLDRLRRYGRGTRLVMGNALVGRLYLSLIQAGVEIRFNAPMQNLIMENGLIVGAEFGSDRGSRLVRARAGVVLATGGVGHQALMRRMLASGGIEFDSLAFERNRGDGVCEALRVGAHLEQHQSNFFWQPVSRVPVESGGYRLFPHLYLDRTKPGMIAVDAAGERFVNEAASYHHFVEGMLNRHKSAAAVPCYFICDTGFIYKYGLGVIAPGTVKLSAYEKQGYIVVSDTLAGLAQKIGISAAGLIASVEKNNRYAVTGNDMDFGKGTTELNRFNGDPDHRPNPCLGSILKPPFCALAVWPADAATSAGLATNSDGVVLNAAGVPINGLYACGNDMASVMRGSYPGPGTTIGPAMVFGYRIGLHAKKRCLEELNDVLRDDGGEVA